MEHHALGEVMDIYMTKIKEMVDVNTVIGDPIYTPDAVSYTHLTLPTICSV